jgi:hypothetical protein
MRPRKQFDWQAMQAYIDEGNGFLRCRQRFGIAHATWAKAIALGDIRVDLAARRYSNARRRHDWAAIQAYYDQGHSMRACRHYFGFSNASWSKALRRGEIVSRGPRVFTIDELATNRSNPREHQAAPLTDGRSSVCLCVVRHF